VVIQAAGPTAAFEWRDVIDGLRPLCRVYAYERAGYGWSEAGSSLYTSASAAQDLRTLVLAGAVASPFVLVAHSLGGVHARVYVATYPSDVIGLVLVDSSHEDQLTALPGEKRDLRRQLRVARAARLMARAGLLKFLVGGQRSPFATTLQKLAPDDRGIAMAQVCDPRAYATLEAELAAVPASLEQAQSLRRSLGDLPLVVITRGRGRGTPAMEAAWRGLQDELAARSTEATHVIAEGSGHYVHEEQPDLVVNAVRKAAGV
jgi:pimeloyl-ACP methyl ester carboxylesterase